MAQEAESIEAHYRSNTPMSRRLFDQGRPSMAGPAKGAYFYPPYPLSMERGEGCHLYDVDGRRYIDCANHHTAQILGHNHPSVMAAVRSQLERGIALGAPTGLEAKIAAEMCRRVASLDRVRFVNSGTEATLHAVRLARGFSQKDKIAKFEGGYHGSHDSVEVSVAPPLDQAGPPQAPHSVATAGGMSSGATDQVLVLPYDDEDAVDRLIGAHREELSCVLFDPKAGVMPQRPEFVRAIREIARRHQIIFILDEIVGFRVGVGGLQAHYGIDPDLTCFGKIVGGGFPVGAFGGRADLMDLLDNSRGTTGFFQSGTFSAHPVAMAAGLAMLRELTPIVFTHLESMGNRLTDGLNEMFRRQNITAHAVNTGSVFSVYLTETAPRTYRDLAKCSGERVREIFLSLLAEGYYLSHGLSMCALSTPMQTEHVDGLILAFERAIGRATTPQETRP